MANLIRRSGGQAGEAPAQVVPRWDPFRIMAEMLGDLTPGTWSRSGGEGMYIPAFEVTERGDSYLFKADLPGFKEDDLDIQLTGNRLTISGKREAETSDDNERCYVYERNYGSFTRTFTLPEGIDAENVKADLKDGVLALTIPKKPEVQPKRISLKPGAGAGAGAGDAGAGAGAKKAAKA